MEVIFMSLQLALISIIVAWCVFFIAKHMLHYLKKKKEKEMLRRDFEEPNE